MPEISMEAIPKEIPSEVSSFSVPSSLAVASAEAANVTMLAKNNTHHHLRVADNRVNSCIEIMSLADDHSFSV